MRRRAVRSESAGPRPGLAQVRRVDLDDRGPEEPHALPHRVRRRRERVADRRVVDLLGLRGQLHREPGQVLDRSVVQVAGEPAPLAVGRVERALEQPLPVTVGALDATSEHVGEREEEQRERHECHEEHRRERPEDVPLLGGDRSELLVDLEQERDAVGGVDPGRDARERAAVRRRGSPFDHLDRPRVEDHATDVVHRGGGPDAFELVRVTDRPVGPDEPHVDERGLRQEDGAEDGAFDRGLRVGRPLLALEQVVGRRPARSPA